MIASADSRLIVKTMIDLAHGLGLTATAEGIETVEQLRILRDLGCDVAQGYLVSAALAVMLGYAMLAVTGGIITAELTNEIRESRQRRQCPHCERSGHEIDARYCKFCGGDLESTSHKQSDQATTHDKLD